jgi:hypothetical protein
MNGLLFRECKHIKNIFEDVYFTKNLFQITLKTDGNILLYHQAIMIRSFSDVFDCCKRGLRQVLLDNELFTKYVVEAPV